MSAEPPPLAKAAETGFDISVEPSPKPGAPVVEGEADGADAQRSLGAALASTYDPARVHDGKTDEELTAEREHATLAAIDVAIVAGAILAADAVLHPDTTVDHPTPPPHDGDFP